MRVLVIIARVLEAITIAGLIAIGWALMTWVR
jgi:hypothetical protein